MFYFAPFAPLRERCFLAYGPRCPGKDKDLFLADGADRADFGAGAAIGAFIGIDNVFVRTFTDSVDWAFGFTGAATNAIISDFITHFLRHLLFKKVVENFYEELE